MTELLIWVLVGLLAVVALAASHVNPLVIYSRRWLVGLAVGALIAAGLVLSFDFYHVPTMPPSGVLDDNG